VATTQKLTGFLLLVLAIGVSVKPCGSQEATRLDSKSTKTEYSFSVRPGRPPLTFRVQIGESGKIGDALVFHQGEQVAFQTLASCDPQLAMELYQEDENRNLIEHADFNFDGFEDVELLQFHHSHLGKSIFCVFLWDDKAGRFRYEPQIPSPDPIPHPETKTITTHNDYMDGSYGDSTYVWSGKTVLEIASKGIAHEKSSPSCPWTAFCYKRINGKLRAVTLKPTGCDDTDPREVTCTPPPLRIINKPKAPPE